MLVLYFFISIIVIIFVVIIYKSFKSYRYRIATNGNKFFIQYLDKRFIFFGKKLWRDYPWDDSTTEFQTIESAKIKLIDLVKSKTYRSNKFSRKHVEVEIDFEGINIQF